MKHRVFYSVAVIGITTTIGQAVLSCLADRGFPSKQVVALDAHQNAGRRIPYRTGELTVESLDMFDFSVPYIAFLCTSSILSDYKDAAVRQGCVVIDCTGIVTTGPCVIPSLNAKDICLAKDNIIGNPTSLTVSLAQVLAPIHQHFPIKRAEATALLGAGEFGNETVSALINQTRCLYTHETLPSGPFNKVQAFNLIPEPNPILTRRTIGQLQDLLHFPVFVTSCLTPLFQGECYATTIETRQPHSVSHLLRFLAHHPYCRLADMADYLTVTPQDVIGDDIIWLTRPVAEKDRTTRFHFWTICDSIRTGAALNAVKIAEHILS